MIMSNEHILDFHDIHMPELRARNAIATTCVQTAGDVIIIPESWSDTIIVIWL
jgi:hypothetical protein